ncbi:MAG: hypothetical protein IPK68_19980 [Bdellovibrionales bacterium]|nr:hypothetical protein [Bdellovibrionales bacterium]
MVSHVLVMREKSPSAFDVVLLGGEMKDVLDREGAHVGAKVYFPQPVRDSRNSVAYLQGFIQETLNNKIRLFFLRSLAVKEVS